MTNSTLSTNNNVHEFTPWDLFVCVAGRPEGITLTRLAHVLNVKKERTLIRPMGDLAELKLVNDHGDRYSLYNSKKAQNLKTTFDYALAYGYDYNAFMTPEMIDFLTNAYKHDYFTEYDIGKERLYPNIIARLIRYKLLIVYDFTPFRGKLVENPFLDGICEYLNLKRGGSFFSGMFRKKLPLERIIKDKVNTDSKTQIAGAKKLIGDELLSTNFFELPKSIVTLKESVMHEDTAVFDEGSSGCYKRAWDKMHSNIKEGKRLSLEVIQEYHAICMETTDLGGKIRDFEVVIRNNKHFKTATYDKIEGLLSKLIEDLYVVQYDDISDKLDLASYVYNQFIYIHPFEDGNSRLARILMAHMLNEQKLPFEEIPSSYEVRFLMATKGYRHRDDSVLKEMLEEIYINYLNLHEMDDALELKIEDAPKKRNFNYAQYGIKKKD